MLLSRLSLVYIIFLYIDLCLCANILVLNPTVAHSHLKFIGNIADILARDGHNVTVLSIVLDTTLPPYGTTDEDIHKVLVDIGRSEDSSVESMDVKSSSFWFEPVHCGLSKQNFDLFRKIAINTVNEVLDRPELIAQMRDSKFDIALFEPYDLSHLGFLELFNIPSIIALSAIGMHGPVTALSGLPRFLSFVPEKWSPYTDKMSFWERLDNHYNYFYKEYDEYLLNRDIQTIFHQKYPNMPSLQEIGNKKVTAIFSNSNEFCESPRITNNMIQYVGGASIYDNNNTELDEDFKKLLNLRKQNVIFSMGSFTKGCDTPLSIKQEILEAFGHFPDVTFLWKYEKCPSDSFDVSKYGNVHLVSWLPQKELLASRKISAFISHGGMNSILEAQYYGVPMITIPLFGDQLSNANNAVARGFALLMRRHAITRQELVDHLSSILPNDSSFQKRAKMISTALQNRPEQYREAIRQHVRVIEANGGPLEYLKLESSNLSLLVLYSIDVIAFVVVVLVLVIVIVVYFLKWFISCCGRQSSSHKKLE